jgi:NAD(P)-dependent dehydrogenase (short-subunit alcohol dehydrogenase family)
VRPAAEQTILVTGSTDGLGRATAHALAEQGACVLLHGRDPARCERTLAELREATRNDRLRAYVADLASLTETRRLAEEVGREAERLDALVCNAGVGGVPERRLSADGHELNLAVNYLSHFILT